MFLDKLLNKIGDFFSGLVHGAEKAWKKLSPEVQNAMLHASGIVDIINNNLDKAPKELLDLITEKFPALPIDKIKQALHVVADDLKISESLNNADLLTLLEHVRDYLNQREGTRWANASDTIAKIIAIVIAPAETKFTAIASLMWFVYQRYIKKH